MSACSSASSPPTDTELLHSDPYLRVELCYRGSLIRIVRTAQVHSDLETMRGSFMAAVQAMDRAGRRGRSLLFDTRAAIGRNDPLFEEAMSVLRPRIDRSFARIAVLVKSAVAVLQVRRWVSEDGVERAVGPDEAALLEFLNVLTPHS